MNAEQAVRVIEIAQGKADEFFEALKAELAGTTERMAGTDPTGAGESHGDTAPWVLGESAPSGEWEEDGAASGQTYKWPDGNVDHYSGFFMYRGRGQFDGVRLGLGYLENGDVVGFSLGSGGGSKRGITYFFPADDFETSNQKISMIRGGGPNGRSGFAPDEAVPPAYADFETAVLRDRKAGKWRVLGVVVDAADTETMLRHTALQARLRKLS